MKIFITGASGFVGGAIALKLKKDHSILALSRSDSSDKKLMGMGVTPVRGSLENIDPTMLEGVDIVIHCAAFVGPWGFRKDFWEGNVEGTRNLLEASSKANVKRFIHMGTEAALFAGQDMVDIDETYPYPKKSPYLYSETKREAEKLVIAANSPDFHTIVLRPRLVWGKGDTSVLPVITEMVKKGQFMWLDNGKAKTSTTNIANLTYAVELALIKGKGGNVYFLTDDTVTNMKDFLTAMLKTQKVSLPSKSISSGVASFAARIVEGVWRFFRIRTQPPLMRFSTDIMSKDCTIRIDKAKAELGYRPIVNIEEGLSSMTVL